MIPRAYIMPAMCAVCPACKSAIDAAALSSSHSSASSPTSAWNAVDLRKDRRLVPIAISRYPAIVQSCPNPIRLSRFNASRNCFGVYLRLLGSGGHMCDETASFSHTDTSIRCWNGNINHMYYTTNSTTSRGKYRWMILTSPPHYIPFDTAWRTRPCRPQ